MSSVIDAIRRAPESHRAAGIGWSLGIAVVAAAVAVGLALLLDGLLEQTPFVPFCAAVAIGAWYGGRRPGLLVAGLCGLAGDYFFLEPKHSLTIESSAELVSLLMYALATVIIVLLIANHRVARREAHAASLRYRRIFEGTADAVIVFDGRNRYLDANPAALAMVGYTRDELLARHVGDLSVSDDREIVQERMRRIRSDGVWRGEAGVRRRDGSIMPVEIAASALDGTGDTTYLMAFRDISARRALERAQQEFLATVTHELRSPLTAMRGHAQLLRRKGVYDQQGIDTILAQIRHLERLIGDLLDAARAGAGQLELRCEPLDLVELAYTGAEEAQATTARHTIRVEAPDEPLIGEWDGDRLSQVLRNLLSNAIKYAPDSGDIVVRVAREDGLAHLSVSDHGPGIPLDAQKDVFTRFYRLAGNPTSAQGLGLGLYITREIVSAHGGRITLDSQPGHGATFTVLLPLG